MAIRPIRSRPGGRTGAGARRLARAPPVDRAVVRPTTTRRSARCGHDRTGIGRGRRPARAAIVRRPTAADVEQVGARPLGEALVRASRPDPDDRGPLRRRPAPAPAGRNRQPPVVRLAARRSGRSRRLRPPHAEHGAIRQRVRRRFGAVDAPVLRRRTRRCEWPDIDWDGSPRPTAYDIDTFERLFPPSSFRSFDEWRNTTQYYQSHVLKVQIETLRTLKYRPTGGFCFSSLADPAPLVSSSVLDHERVPKDRATRSCAPPALRCSSSSSRCPTG